MAFELRTPSLAELPTCRRMLFGEQPPPEIFAETTVVAIDGEQVVGVAAFTPQPGSVALVWPPATVVSPRRKTCESLLRQLAGLLDRSGLKLAHALVPPASDAAAPLLRTGFGLITRVLWMELEDKLPTNRRQAGFTVAPYSTDVDTQFVKLLERTGIETADCPEVHGIRTGREMLVGHRAVGEFDPVSWRIFSERENEIGLVLLNHHAGYSEVVYLGVLPEHRGRGLGTQILRDALQAERQRGHTHFKLAVDSRNLPAMRVYRRLGFRVATERELWLRVNEIG